jgi:hypothetical protein
MVEKKGAARAAPRAARARRQQQGVMHQCHSGGCQAETISQRAGGDWLR